MNENMHEILKGYQGLKQYYREFAEELNIDQH